MVVNSKISDGSGTNLRAAVDNADNSEKAGLVVATRPLKPLVTQVRFLTNVNQGSDMNIDASFSGTPEGVHDGIDSVLWTASALSGSWTFDSTTQAHSGTNSVDATNTLNNNEAQFEDGTSITADSYVALTGWIFISNWSVLGTKNVELRARNAGVDVGNVVNLSNYVDTTSFGTWLKFSIPMDDFGLTTETITQLIVRTVDEGSGNAPSYYLDDIQWEQTGGSTEYVLEPNVGEWMHVESVTISMADAFAGTLTDGTMPRIPYDSFLGVAKLSNGFVINTTSGGNPVFVGTIQQMMDLMQLPAALITGSGGDGTNTWFSIRFDFVEPIILKNDSQDKISFTINDDMSGLLHFRVSAQVARENRSQ